MTLVMFYDVWLPNITHTIFPASVHFRDNDIRSKKECIRGVLWIFSEGFCHLLGLHVNPPSLSVWLIERMPLQVINGKWRLLKTIYMFTYFPRCFRHLHVFPINPHSLPFKEYFYNTTFQPFLGFSLKTKLPSNRKMCVMHRPHISQCGRWWWAQLPGLLYSCPSHLPKNISHLPRHTVNNFKKGSYPQKIIKTNSIFINHLQAYHMNSV